MKSYNIGILGGDGIGPEVMAEVRRVIDWYGAKRGLVFDVSEDLVGGAAYDAHGTPLQASVTAMPGVRFTSFSPTRITESFISTRAA